MPFVARTRCLNLVFLKKCLVMYCKTLVSIQNRSGQLCAIFVCCSLVCFSHAHVNWLFLPKMCLQLYNYSVVKKMLSSVTVLNHPPPPPAAPYYPRCVIWGFLDAVSAVNPWCTKIRSSGTRSGGRTKSIDLQILPTTIT